MSCEDRTFSTTEGRITNTLTRRRFVALAGAALAALVADRRRAAAALTTGGGGARYVSQPEWNLAPVSVGTQAPGTAPGSIFVAPFVWGAKSVAPGTSGPLILDDHGEPVWFLPLTTVVAQDLQVQTYRGEPVLTWYEGPAGGTYGGSWVIFDSSYREVKRVHAGNGYSGDLHEFLITSRDTALLTIYNEVEADLTSIGGPSSGRVVEGIVQEVEIAGGRVLFEWHSLDHVPLTESYRTQTTPAGNVDYFHLNSIGVDPDDGQLVVSSRHTSTVYKVDRETGAILWRLGGKQSDFSLGPGASFNFQHDARPHANGILTVFDNGASGPGAQDVEPASRPMRLQLDEQAMTAELLQVFSAGDPRLAIALGDVQELPDGGFFIGWGAAGPFSEFDPDGRLRYDADFATGTVSYRAFRHPWVGRPARPPAIAALRNGDGSRTVYASWNGATEVRHWTLRGGAREQELRPLRTTPRRGFETPIQVPAGIRYAAVVALDARGRKLGASRTLRLA